jgi:hypothetical protein
MNEFPGWTVGIGCTLLGRRARIPELPQAENALQYEPVQVCLDASHVGPISHVNRDDIGIEKTHRPKTEPTGCLVGKMIFIYAAGTRGGRRETADCCATGGSEQATKAEATGNGPGRRIDHGAPRDAVEEYGNTSDAIPACVRGLRPKHLEPMVGLRDFDEDFVAHSGCLAQRHPLREDACRYLTP